MKSDCCGAEVFGKDIYEDYDDAPVDVAYVCSKCNKICIPIQEISDYPCGRFKSVKKGMKDEDAGEVMK